MQEGLKCLVFLTCEAGGIQSVMSPEVGGKDTVGYTILDSCPSVGEGKSKLGLGINLGGIVK